MTDTTSRHRPHRPRAQAGPGVRQALHRFGHLQPRRRDRLRRLPLAGQRHHPQPPAHRPGRRRPAPALAGVHPPRRGHHRSGRPAQGDRADGCGSHRAHSGRGVRGAGAEQPALARTRWRQAGPSAPTPCLYAVLLLANAAARVRRGAAGQRRPDASCPPSSPPSRWKRPTAGMWAGEMVANAFVGPPMGSLLIGGDVRPAFLRRRRHLRRGRRPGVHAHRRLPGRAPDAGEKVSWKTEIGEGFRWLWRHPLLRPMAIILGYLNGLGHGRRHLRAVRPGSPRGRRLRLRPDRHRCRRRRGAGQVAGPRDQPGAWAAGRRCTSPCSRAW